MSKETDLLESSGQRVVSGSTLSARILNQRNSSPDSSLGICMDCFNIDHHSGTRSGENGHLEIKCSLEPGWTPVRFGKTPEDCDLPLKKKLKFK